MTPEDQEAWRKIDRDRSRAMGYSRKYYAKNAEKILSINRERRAKNPDQFKQIELKCKVANPEKWAIRKLKWKAANRDKENAFPSSIAKRLGLPTSILLAHPDLMEAKREHLKALRQLRNQTKADNAQES